MRALYLDCFSGVSGDMFLGALVGLGLDFDAWRDTLASLPLEGYRVERRPVRRGAVQCVKVDVVVDADHEHRRLGDVVAVLEGGGLPAAAIERARRVFERLAEAEGRVHGEPAEAVTFHEVGAVDAIVDVAGAALGLELLAIERVVCSPITLGRHVADTAHGAIPTPAPATLELLRGAPVRPTEIAAELATPTGVALVTTLADEYGAAPAGRVLEIGYGAGARDLAGRSNALRAVLLDVDAAAAPDDDIAWVVEANIDDMSPEQVGAVVPLLLESGALDAWTTPVTMKKGRPGLRLGALAGETALAAVEDAILRHTSTFGVRRHRVARTMLARSVTPVETAFGPIRVKRGLRNDEEWKAAPEYDDCRRAAVARGVPIQRVYAAAVAAWAARTTEST